MNAQQDAHAPGFLAALHALARHDDFSVEISGDALRLNVAIEALGCKPLRANGTPSALEAALPGAIAKYTRWVDTQARKDLDDDEAEIFLPAGADDAQASTPAKRVRAKAPAKPKRKARVARPAKATSRAAPKKRKPAPAKKASGSARHTREECIADYRATKAKHAKAGKPFTRRLYVDNNTTGRSYERHWKNNWNAFVKDADKDAPAASKPATTKAAPKSAPAKKAPVKPAKPHKGAAKPTGGWKVKLKGKEIGATIFDKKPGDSYVCSAGTFTVDKVDAEKREIHVLPAKATASTTPAPTAIAPADKWPFPTDSKPPAPADDKPAGTPATATTE